MDSHKYSDAISIPNADGNGDDLYSSVGHADQSVPTATTANRHAPAGDLPLRYADGVRSSGGNGYPDAHDDSGRR